MVALLQYLHNIYPLSEGLKEHLLRIVKSKKIKKRDFLLKAGRKCEHIYFIEEGLLRCFYITNKNEVSSWFMKEGDLAISIKSFFEQQPSYESIQALEDCYLYFISYKELQWIYHHFPEFNFVGRVLTERYYNLCDQRLYAIRMHSAPERYEYLVQNFPDLIKRIPGTHIASYLGITFETLSRIKAKRKG